MMEVDLNKSKRGRPRAFHDKSESNTVQSLDKAMVVLKVVSEGNGLTLSEIANKSAHAAPTVYRSLVTMQQHGIVDFDEASQLWRVGVEAFRIGSRFLLNTNVAEQARPIMQELMNITGETANLGIIANAEVVFLSQVETHEPIRAFFRPGTRGAVHASGIGKAVFAFCSDSFASTVIAKLGFVKFTPKTILSREDLVAMRAEAQTIGFAIDDEERTLGMRCIAAPIFDSFGEAIAAVSVSGPTVRMSHEKIPGLGQTVREAADRITASTGGRQPSANGGRSGF